MGEVTEANEPALDLINVSQSAGFVVECEKCHAETDINSLIFISTQMDLSTFLQTSVEGNVILFHYKTYNCLNDAMRNSLTQLLVSRELFLILKKYNISLENPLKKLV